MRKFLPFAALILLFINPAARAESVSKPALVFTAAGDCSGNKDTTASLKLLARVHPDFHLALGDLSYSRRPEQEWCAYVKSYIGDLPFEILCGNHESHGRHGFIDNFRMGLPDRLGAIGDYGREYYFDYPAHKPLARFILVSPGLIYKDEGRMNYRKGSPHYQWLSVAIDSARIARIPWVIVGMHENCLSAGQKSCEIGEDVFNLMIDKKVDLILQGHDHTYQRSRPLAHGAGCSWVRAGEYNAHCVASPEEDTNYSKGAGSIVLIDGTFGAHLTYLIKIGKEADYFVKTMGGNKTPAKGFTKFTVSEDELSAQFMRSSGEDFEDHFVIRNSPASPVSSRKP